MPLVNGERYLISSWRPRELVNLNLGLVRLLLWGPWPFLSLSIGLPSKGTLGGSGKGRAFQMYFGIKCDPSKTDDARRNGYPSGGYWMRLDWYECAAFRIHDVAVQPEWRDQGGS